jgi:hypothetical protein
MALIVLSLDLLERGRFATVRRVLSVNLAFERAIVFVVVQFGH